MRTPATWLVVGGLAALGLFAARDALRSDEPAAAPAATQLEKRPRPALTAVALRPPAIRDRTRLAGELAALGVNGVLRVVETNCRRHLLLLPQLAWTRPRGAAGPECSFGSEPVVHPPTGISALEIDYRTTQAYSEVWHYVFSGSAPAFKPSGTLTFVRGGRLLEWTVRCSPGSTIVTFRGSHATDRCVHAVPRAPRRLREVVWIGEAEYAALVGSDAVSSLLVVRRGRMRSLFRAVGARMSALEASPRGGYLAARVDGAVLVFDGRRPGTFVLPPGAGPARAVTWSPDDRFVALATETSLLVYPAAAPDRAVALPVSVVGLEWR